MRRATAGLAMIVVVGVLGVLAVVAAAFVTMAQLERKASQQRMNAAKAYLLAKSGIEDALARLGMGQDSQATRNRYGGEDWDGDGALGVFESQQEIYQTGKLNTDDCPVRYALRSSFFADDGTGKPKYRPVDGKMRGYSGMLSGDRAPDGNQYALKMASGGGFYINGGDPVRQTVAGPPPTPPTDYNDVLKRMLGVLADAINHDGGSVGQADGWALIDRRPLTGWQNFNQVRDLALGGSQAKLDALQPYLTLQAWVDQRVIAPSAAPGMAGRPYEDWSAIKLARTPNLAAPADHAPDFERIPRVGGRIVGRAPVDLAWARTRRPALIALLADLQGLYVDQVTGELLQAGVLSPVQLALDWTQPTDDCRTVVSAVLTSTSALATWQQWNDFCDTLSLTGTPDQAQAKRDLLKANFNPNTDLNKFNPNPSLWKLMDKSDLLVYSTEFSLSPLEGHRVSCAGRILDASGRLLAGRTLTATITGPSVLRLGSQRDFIGENPGDPSAPYITAAAPPGGEPTWGHALTLLGLPPTGISLQSYPEPYVLDATSGKLKINPADYDGNLQLATVDTPKDKLYTVTATTHVMMMLARFDDSMDLDVSRAKITGQAPPSKPDLDWDRNQTDTSQVSTAQLGTGLLQEVSPGSGVINTLYPDGCYSEPNRIPAYLDQDFPPDQGNSNGFRGALSFWVKLNDLFIPRGSSRVLLDRSRQRADATAHTQWFGIWSANPFYLAEFESKIENHIGNMPQNHDFRVSPGSLRPVHRWTLLTLGWDFRAQRDDYGLGAFLVDRGGPGDSTSYPLGWPTNDHNSPGGAEDITQDDTYGPHHLTLGDRVGAVSPATYDEFALYDFGGAVPPGPVPADAQGAPGTLAGERYRIGRYYRESVYKNNPLDLTQFPGNPSLFPGNNAAQWFSGRIDLGAVTLRSLSWTQIVPRGLKAPVPAVGWNGRPPQPGWDGDPDTVTDPVYGSPGDGRIVFDLADTGGGDYLKDTASPPQPINTLFTQDALSAVGRPVNAPFRLHAVFQPNLADPTNTPILDPLTLDDITLTYWKASGPGLSAWQEGE